MVQISGRQFSRVYSDQAHEQSKKTIKFIISPIDFVNGVRDDFQKRWEIEGPEIAEYLQHVERKILQGTNKN